jgi:hypothetical protein
LGAWIETSAPELLRASEAANIDYGQNEDIAPSVKPKTEEPEHGRPADPRSTPAALNWRGDGKAQIDFN